MYCKWQNYKKYYANNFPTAFIYIHMHYSVAYLLHIYAILNTQLQFQILGILFGINKWSCKLNQSTYQALSWHK